MAVDWIDVLVAVLVAVELKAVELEWSGSVKDSTDSSGVVVFEVVTLPLISGAELKA